MRDGKTGLRSLAAAAGAALAPSAGSSASRAGGAGPMRRQPPSGPTISCGREGPARSLRKRGRRPAEPGEAGACGPEAHGPEESRRKRRMVGRASEREEVDSDKSGEASGAGKAEARWPVAGRGQVGPSHLWDQQGLGAEKEARSSCNREDAVRKRPGATPSLAFVPQPAPSWFYH